MSVKSSKSMRMKNKKKSKKDKMTVHDRKNTAQSCSLDLHTLFRVSHDEDQGDQHGNLIGQMFIHSKAKIMWEVISFFNLACIWSNTLKNQ